MALELDGPDLWMKAWSKLFSVYDHPMEYWDSRERHAKTLGVPEDTQDWYAVRRVYKKLCVLHHPDHGGDRALFDEIQEAYQWFKDQLKK